MARTVAFFFDVGSPTAYLAWTQLPRLCEEVGAQLRYRPMLLGGIFQATGNASPMMVPSKARYMLRDMARFAARYGVPLTMNPHFPINTLHLMRLLTGVQLRQPERFAALLTAVFRAIWADAENLGDPQRVAAVLQAAGFEPSEVLALAGDAEIKAQLKATTDEAVQRGVFGAPSFLVGEELFFGQDRLDFVREALLGEPSHD